MSNTFIGFRPTCLLSNGYGLQSWRLNDNFFVLIPKRGSANDLKRLWTFFLYIGKIKVHVKKEAPEEGLKAYRKYALAN